jgi:folate-binding protein YgfZ
LRNYSLSIDDVNKYRPLELNYDLLRVSFDKGCYRGQEVVARMKYLGVNRRRFSTVIIKSDYEFEKDFKVVGNIIDLKNCGVFNAIIKREDLETLKENKGVITII